MPTYILQTPLAAIFALMLSPACKQLDRHMMAASAKPAVRDPVSAAMATGDLDSARSALNQMLFAREMNAAKSALDEANPQDALSAVDRALAIMPGDPLALTLMAEGSVALADHLIATGSGALFVESALVDAFNSYTSLAPSPQVLTSAAEIATRLGREQDALVISRSAVTSLNEDANKANLQLAKRAFKALGQAALRVYITQLQQSEDTGTEDLGAEHKQAFAEAENALMAVLGFDPDGTQNWIDLADLYLWRNDSGSAVETIKRGLDRRPFERDLLEALIRSAGPNRALSELERLPAPSPVRDLYVGRERLLGSIPLQASAPAQALSAATLAETELGHITRSNPALFQEARGWRIIARAVQGWALYNQSQFKKAANAFLSMDLLIEGGLDWRLEGRVRSGTDGMYFIGDQYRQRGDWEAAAETFRTLESSQPDSINWANNAGFFARDAAVATEAQGRDLCHAAAGQLRDDRRREGLRALIGLAPGDLSDTEERAAFALAAQDRFHRARALAEKSYASYVHASELAPNDVRIINDTALIQVYYLHDDTNAARTYLQRAIELGIAQIADDDAQQALDEEARHALEEALGDALQNMGVLHLLLLDDPTSAIDYLERSREIGPNPRPIITEALIPWCKGELQVPLEEIMPEVHWCAPCTENQ